MSKKEKGKDEYMPIEPIERIYGILKNEINVRRHVPEERGDKDNLN